jgi:hypothetical protein
MAGLQAPLSTLRAAPRGALRMTRGQSGLLFLHCSGLSPSALCRFLGAPLFTLCRSPGAQAYYIFRFVCTPVDRRKYTGIDLSPILIDRAEQLYSFENRSFLVGSIYDLPFSNGSFDAAFSVNLWHLLADLDMASNGTRLRRPRPKWPRLRRRSRSLPRRRTQNRPTRGKLPA